MAGGSSAQPQGQPSQGSPLDKQGQPQSARENTPDKPGGEKPQGEKDGQKPDPSNDPSGQPKSPRESTADSDNRRAQPPPSSDAARNDPAQQTERWGDLPQHVRDLFRTEGGGDMPLVYRDWIDSYYRRLNQRP